MFLNLLLIVYIVYFQMLTPLFISKHQRFHGKWSVFRWKMVCLSPEMVCFRWKVVCFSLETGLCLLENGLFSLSSCYTSRAMMVEEPGCPSSLHEPLWGKMMILSQPFPPPAFPRAIDFTGLLLIRQDSCQKNIMKVK